jgi:hypothetical protein
MLFQRDKDLTPTVITDELVFCYESVVINSVTYYKGYADNVASREVLDGTKSYVKRNDTSVSQTIIVAGLPTTGQVYWNTDDGYVLSTISLLYKIKYNAYVPIRQHTSIEKNILEYVTTSLAVTDTIGVYRKVYFYEVNVGHQTGSCSLVISCAGQTASSITLSEGNNYGTLSQEIKIPSGQALTLTFTATDAADFNVILKDI